MFENINHSKNLLYKSEVNANNVDIGDKTYIYINLPTNSEIIIRRSITFSPSLDVFEGRQKEIDEVCQKLNQFKKVVLVSGIGGIGKTTLAKKIFLELANSLESEKPVYQHIAYLETGQNLYQAFGQDQALIDNLHLQNDINQIPLDIPDRPKKIFDLIINRLSQLEGKKLLCLDNIPEDLDNVLALVNYDWKILTTAREQIEGAETYQLWEMNETDAVKTFAVYFGKKFDELNTIEQEQIKQIVSRLSNHALAIELVAKNAKELGWNLEKINEKLKQKGLNISNYADVKTSHVGKERIENIFKYLLTIFPIENLDEFEQNFLIQNSLIPAIGIRPQTWVELLKEDEDKLAITLKKLYRKGWLNYNDIADEYIMHAVIAEVIMNKNQELIPELSNQIINFLSIKLATDGNFLINSSPTNILPFFKIGEKISINYKEPNATVGLLLSYIADYYKNIGNFGEALKSLIKAEKILENTNELDFTVCLGNIGRLFQESGNLEEAFKYFQKRNLQCKKILKNNSNKDQIEFIKNSLAISFAELANIYQLLGNITESIDNFKQSISLHEEIIKSIDDSILKNLKFNLSNSYSGLADCYLRKGDYKEAIQFYQKCFDIKELLYKENPKKENYKRGFSISCARFGDIYQLNGNFKDALKFFKLSNQLSEELYSNNSKSLIFGEDLACSYEKLGKLYQIKGEFNTAFSFFQKRYLLSLKLNNIYSESEVLKVHLLVSFLNLGELYQELSDIEKAFNYFKQYFELSEDYFKINQSSNILKYHVALAHSKLSGIYFSKYQFDLALQYSKIGLNYVMELWNNSLDSVDIANFVAVFYCQIGQIYLNLNENSDAKINFNKAEKIFIELIEKMPENVEFLTKLYSIRNQLQNI